MPATVTIIKCFAHLKPSWSLLTFIYPEVKFNFHSLPTEQLLQQQDG